MVCRKCGASGLRRENRYGFLQLKIFPLFGLFPWECVFCRKTLLYHKQFEDVELHDRRPRPGVPRTVRP
jgi:hypothetical protein